MAMKLSNEVGSPITLALGHLISAHVRHSLGNHDEAKEHLSQALQLAKQTKAKNLQFYTLMAEALFALKEEDQVLGLKPLRKALALGREGKFLDPCIDLQSDMAKVWAKALEAGIEVEYVQELIRRRNLITEKPPLHLENWPWPLKVFTLGRFVILKDGQPFKFTRKVQQKPLSMLKALIAFGGEEVREDQISDALWPEADGDVAHESFATTLHRLRKLIGHEKAIQLREGRLSLDERLCWVDVWVFERLLGQAEARWREGLKDSAVQLGQKAMEIYKGPFLEREIEQPWAISMRERLRGKFMRNVGKLGQYWEQAGQWEKSVDCYQKGLEVDELAEEFYQGLMTCYQHLGRRAEALSIYNRCRRTLAQAFGIEPSAKTNSIYRSLNSEKQASGDKEIRK
jgi:LuxR family maltose regulon positive regulatory protein